MRLTPSDLAKLVTILDKIDRGLTQPRFPDRIGRFLRQYRTGRGKLDQILATRQIERRADAAISGHALDTIEIHALLEPGVSLMRFPLGEVGDTLAMSEELGGLVNMVMWLKGPVANAAYNMLRENPELRLSGDYRWTPPGRLTPGEARVQSATVTTNWRYARCLKAVADDLVRPPHALEYVLDYRLGPPGLKFFRCVCALKRGVEWQVLPGLAKPTRLESAGAIPEARSTLKSSTMAALLIYREPWSQAWTIVAGADIDADDVFAHAITWADFQRELDGSATDGTLIAGIRDSLHASGLRASDIARPNLQRSLLPLSRDILRWLHGSS